MVFNPLSCFAVARVAAIVIQTLSKPLTVRVSVTEGHPLNQDLPTVKVIGIFLYVIILKILKTISYCFEPTVREP